jgi:hypothetical protein
MTTAPVPITYNTEGVDLCDAYLDALDATGIEQGGMLGALVRSLVGEVRRRRDEVAGLRRTLAAAKEGNEVLWADRDARVAAHQAAAETIRGLRAELEAERQVSENGRRLHVEDQAAMQGYIDQRDAARAEADRMRLCLEQLDRGGGLGHSAHRDIDAALGREPRFHVDQKA